MAKVVVAPKVKTEKASKPKAVKPKVAKDVVVLTEKKIKTTKASKALPEATVGPLKPKDKAIKKAEPLKEVHSVLVTLPKPETEKSPYFEIAKKYNILVEFFPFVKVEGISGRDFKKQKLDIVEHTAIIFTSRNAVEHFFRSWGAGFFHIF